MEAVDDKVGSNGVVVIPVSAPERAHEGAEEDEAEEVEDDEEMVVVEHVRVLSGSVGVEEEDEDDDMHGKSGRLGKSA